MESIRDGLSSMAKSSFRSLDSGWNTPGSSFQRTDTSSMLSSNDVNMMHISNLSQSLKTKPKLQTKVFESLEDRLERRQQEILEQVVRKQREFTKQRMEKQEEERLNQQWEEEKERFLKELAGDIVLGGSAKPLPPSLLSITNNIPVSVVHAADLPTMAQNHVQVVAKWNRDPDLNAVEEFSRIASPSKFPSYAMAWKLLANIMGKSNPTSIAAGTLAHLSRHFQSHIIGTVQKASLAGQDVSLSTTFSNEMANSVAAFVKLTHGSNATIWPLIYYCLRCGDTVAATTVLESTSTEIDPALRHIVSSLAQLQGSSSCLWDGALARMNPNSALDYHSRSNDPYEEACWTLLSLSEMLTGTVVTTIEDYIFAKLWYAIQQPNVIELLKETGNAIVELGPKYFEETGESCGWAYAWPLLLTQQYRASLTHLAKVGGPLGLLQATHLGITMTDVQDLGNVVSGKETFLAHLLVELSQQLQIADASTALEYLIRIPNPDQKQREVVRLILETRQFETLAGHISSDGIRQKGDSALSHHFTEFEISDILEDAALLAKSKKNPRDALELLNLAERYVTLLELLNQELVAQVNKDFNSDERQSWKDTAQQFQLWHLSGRRTYVMDVLTKHHKTSLVQTLLMILKLFDFFDALTMQNFHGAWDIVESFDLLPTSMADIQAKETKFRSLDPILNEIFPDLFLGAMKALYHQHEILKHSGIMTITGTVAQRLLELRNKSSALISFTGRLSLKNAREQLSLMTRMEAAMV